MDFLIDKNLGKTIKTAGLAALGLAAVVSISIIFKRLGHSDDQSSIQQQVQEQKKKPAGIYNQGNTCFVNSLLQALAPLKSFVRNLDQILNQVGQNKNIHQDLIFELKNALQKINEQSQSVEVINFLNSIGKFSEMINLQQQDAYELFSFIVSSFQYVSNQRKNMSLKGSRLSENSNTQLEQSLFNFQQSIQSLRKVNNCLLGYIKSSIICLSCKEEQNIKIYPFYDLSFDICPQNIRTLIDAILHFQQKQKISGWTCTRCSINEYLKKLSTTKKQLVLEHPNQWQILVQICNQIEDFLKSISSQELDISQINLKLGKFVSKYEKQYKNLGDNHQFRDRVFLQITPVERTITKQSIISLYPKILAIHLKQLSINPMTGEPVLLKKLINFPNILQINVKNGKKKYELVSLISHAGDQSQGHYFTFRKLSTQSEGWFLISDTMSVQCKQSFIKAHMPYMLFYQLVQ